MITIIIYIVVGVILIFGLVKLIDLYLPKKLRPVLSILLFIAIVVLGYYNYNAIYGPVEFNKTKEKRYTKVIERLQDIRKAQLAHKEITRTYAPSFDSLVRFIDTAQFTITQRRDTTYLDEEFKRIYKVDKYIDDYVIDTLDFVSVKDSLFGKSDRYKKMQIIPYTDGNKFEMQSGLLKVKNTNVPVFEVKADKKLILADLDNDLLIQELQTVSVDGVNGRYIKVGDLNEVSTSGNWPSNYGKAD
ncbi:hypothetical protein [Psychroflexus salis]|uniref:Uncharacterized protein n=1 Tax=Psychroflexus salis TaxID=1526574 RepID=A0A917E8E6_9FLAO|nr:hypothetical protein [Psychroflexus salis]GGE15075.1 hypothetical protein GCM10010831_15490 [Psychroflexus salis]